MNQCVVQYYRTNRLFVSQLIRFAMASLMLVTLIDITNILNRQAPKVRLSVS